METEIIFEELQAACEKRPPRELKANNWISEATWTLIDNRAMARKRGMLTQQGMRRWGQKIKALLNSDRIKRAAKVPVQIEGHLFSGDLKEAWLCLKGLVYSGLGQATKILPHLHVKNLHLGSVSMPWHGSEAVGMVDKK